MAAGKVGHCDLPEKNKKVGKQVLKVSGLGHSGSATGFKASGFRALRATGVLDLNSASTPKPRTPNPKPYISEPLNPKPYTP